MSRTAFEYNMGVVNRSPSRLLRPLTAAAAVTAALVSAGASGATPVPPPTSMPAPAGVDCSRADEPFDDSLLPAEQEVLLTLGDRDDDFASLTFESQTLIAGPTVIVAGAEPAVSPSDISVNYNGRPAVEIHGIPSGMTCRFSLTSQPGYYVATSAAGGATVDWWVSADLSAVPDAADQIALASNLLGGEANFTDACDILTANAVGAAIPVGVLGTVGPVTVESTPAAAQAWQRECLWSVALGDGTTDPAAIGVALVVDPPGDEAVADFAERAEADAERPGYLEINRDCYLLEHTVTCLVDDVVFAVGVAGGDVTAGSPQAWDLDGLAVTLAVNVANRLD